VFEIALELAIFGVTLRMLFNLQRRWSGKFKATMVFALRLPYVALSSKRHSSKLTCHFAAS
jgi:hypothetical protein